MFLGATLERVIFCAGICGCENQGLCLGSPICNLIILPHVRFNKCQREYNKVKYSTIICEIIQLICVLIVLRCYQPYFFIFWNSFFCIIGPNISTTSYYAPPVIVLSTYQYLQYTLSYHSKFWKLLKTYFLLILKPC